MLTVQHCTDTAAQQWSATNAGQGRKTGPEGQAIVKQLGKQQVNSLFTHLRKIAQHPLLVRNLFSDAQVQSLVKVAHQRQVLCC